MTLIPHGACESGICLAAPGSAVCFNSSCSDGVLGAGEASTTRALDLYNNKCYIRFVMTGEYLRSSRRKAGWTQKRLAAGLGLTQAYLSLMEHERRSVPDHVARAVARLLRLPATALPVPESTANKAVPEQWIEQALARLDYPGFAYRKNPGARRNPTEVLLKSLACDDLDPRLVEALPWLLLQFEGFSFETLAAPAKLGNLQNRLGFMVSLAREFAEQDPRWRHRTGELRHLEESLEPSRLAREDAYGAMARTEHMRDWLRNNRSRAAEHWNLLTDLKRGHLPYAGQDHGTVAELPA
ncbi:MAG: helix-turn-helix domain-containing protein [Acidobacteriota bacterium]